MKPCLMMPLCGLSFADVSLAALECRGNKRETAKRLGVGERSLEAAIKREGLDRWFAGRHAPKNRTRCVSREDIIKVAKEGYLKADAAEILGISEYYLKDLIKLHRITEFAENRGHKVKIGMRGYCQ